MNALFPGSSTYGSVTYGLGTLLLNGSSLEVIFEEGFVVIREKGSNMRILVIDLSTGMVCDVFDLNLQGSYCYSNQQTEWAYDLGEALLNSTNIFDILVNYFNNINDTFNYIQDIISGAFESIDDFLDSMDNNFLGIVGTIAITVGITALLMSNPAGWVILGGIALVTLGGILTYYSDDLNKGWTYERGAWFLFDIAISIPFGVYKSGFIVGEIIIKEYSFSNTKYVIMYSDDAFEVLSKYSLITTINYEPYGTLKSIIASAYGTTDSPTLLGKIFLEWYKGTFIFHPIISELINYIYNNS